MFGGAATNSFPPAQSSTPSNSFTTSSFPAFGAGNQSSTFNPQPPSSGFNFSAGNNPFSASTSETNGAAPAPSFGSGSSIFGAQPSSNPFGGIQTASTTSSAAPTSMFSTTSGASQPSMFGNAGSSATNGAGSPAPASQPFTFGSTASAAPNAASAPAPASQPFTFGAPASPAPEKASTPAPSSMFGGYGTSQPAAAPASPVSSNMFGFGANTQKSEAPTTPTTPQKSMFSFGATTPAADPPATAPSAGLFNFGSTTPKPETAATPAPSTSLFGAPSAAAQGTSTPASAPASNPFASLQSATSNTPSLFSAGTPQQTPQAQEKAPATTSMFGSAKPAETSGNAPSETPKPNLFASLVKPNSTPAAAPAASSTGFTFGVNQSNDNASKSTSQPSSTSMFKAPEAPKANMFSGFSTPQPAKTSNNEQAKAGMFSAQPKASSGMFSQPSQSENSNAGSLFKTQSDLTPPSQATLSTETSKAAPQQFPTKEASNPFTKLPAPSADSQNLFGGSSFSPKEQTSTSPASSSPAPAMSSLSGTTVSAGTASAPQLPKVPKISVPKEWVLLDVANGQGVDGMYKTVVELTEQLQAVNQLFRDRLNTLPLTADWSSMSQWHFQSATAIKKKIDSIKKQRAAANGVTGFESTLSTKRKPSDDSHDARDSTPSKRLNMTAAPSTPTPQPASSIKSNLPTSATSNIFAKAIGNKSPAPEQTSDKTSTLPKATAPAAGFTPSFGASKNAEAPKTSTSGGFTPSFGTSNGINAPKAPSSGGFKPSFGASTTASTGGFKPTTGGSGGFLGQFAKTAKSYEQLAAERKQKVKDEDWDEDDETEEEWDARYDREEAERLEKEKKQIAAAPGFSFGGAKPSADARSTAPAGPAASAAPASNPFASLSKPASGASTPGLFTPKAGSPTPSTTGGRSIFDAPSAGQTPPPSNPFQHLSSGASSNHQDESDESEQEEEDEEQTGEKSKEEESAGSTEPSTPKQSFGGSESGSVKAAEDTPKADAASKGSLLSRMSKGEDSAGESEKETSSGSIFGQTNGTTTPTNKPFAFFNFQAAGANTAPPKSAFAGDQTFKAGSPIKFGGDAPATEKKGAPAFQFQPATPSPADFSTTPAKPPPTSLFSFGGSTAGASLLPPKTGLGSAPSSVFSSRAATPLSEVETSAASTGGDDDEEGGKQEQIDLSQLTAEEKDANDVVFHIETALAKQQNAETKAWENFARGPLWILKDKVTGKCFVRIRIASGATPLNYQILPALRSTVAGKSKKMVQATRPGKDKGLMPVYFAVKDSEIAEEFSRKYNESMPPS